jgi:hypothetical protein
LWHLDAGHVSQCPPEWTVGVFGDKLRKQRELRGISLDAISTTTKISPRMLRAIEDERFDQLPGGVFNKGFVRAYARQVGLDEDDAVTDYLAALRESQIQSQTILPNFRAPADHTTTPTEDLRPASSNANVDATGESHRNHNHATGSQNSEQHESSADSVTDRRLRTDDRRQHPRRNADREFHVEDAHNDESRSSQEPPEQNLHHDVPSAPLSFLSLDSPASHDSISDPRETAAPPVAADTRSGQVPWGKLAVALLLITLTLALWAFHRRSHSAAASQPVSPFPATSPVAAALNSTAPPATTPAVAHNPPASSGTVVNHAAVASPDSDVDPPLTIHSRPSTPQPPPRFTLVIRAEQTSWVSITADGQPVAQETLIAPANTSVRASHEIVVKTGNAAGLSFMLGNQDISAHGAPGEVRTFTFDATGLRASSPAQSANTTR